MVREGQHKRPLLTYDKACISELSNVIQSRVHKGLNETHKATTFRHGDYGGRLTVRS